MNHVIRLFIIASGLVLEPAVARQPDRMGYIETAPGVSVYYERYGNGPTFVFVPNRLFMPEFVALARPERSLILYDMRNRGLSAPVEDKSKITIIGDVEDVEALRQHFRAQKLSLVGYSYLGLMVAQYATQHPEHVERLVQIGSVPRNYGTPYPADQQGSTDSLSEEGKAARAVWQRLAKESSAGPIERCRALARYLSFLLVGNPDNHSRVPQTCEYENESIANMERHLAAHFSDLQKREFPREPFTKLEQPVLTLHGTLDRNAPYGAGLEWATTFRNGRLITVSGGAHQLWLDDPQIIAEIDQFLAGQWPGRAQRFGRE